MENKENDITWIWLLESNVSTTEAYKFFILFLNILFSLLMQIGVSIHSNSLITLSKRAPICSAV